MERSETPGLDQTLLAKRIDEILGSCGAAK